jgi:hypothetical protein
MAKNLSQAQAAFERMAGVKKITASEFNKTVANQNNMVFAEGDIINFPQDLTDRIFEQELRIRGQVQKDEDGNPRTMQFLLCEVEHKNGSKEAMQVFPSMFSRVASVVDENGISTGQVEPTKGAATEEILNNFGGATSWRLLSISPRTMTVRSRYLLSTSIAYLVMVIVSAI